MTDILFPDIVKILNKIHKDFPDIKFGRAIQSAVDNNKRIHNIDLHNLSSKQLLKALTEFYENTKKMRDKYGS